MRENEAAWCSDYADRKAADASYTFRWPGHAGKRLDQLLRPLLEGLTEGHCSYCDGFPLRVHERTPAIDHFRPKGQAHPEFWHLAVAWSNLYVTCGHCNEWKLEQWEEALLAPDGSEYEFDRYFAYDPSSGRVEVSAAANPEDQARAAATIRIFGFNEGDLPSQRKFMHRRFDPERDAEVDYPYRFMLI